MCNFQLYYVIIQVVKYTLAQHKHYKKNLLESTLFKVPKQRWREIRTRRWNGTNKMERKNKQKGDNHKNNLQLVKLLRHGAINFSFRWETIQSGG